VIDLAAFLGLGSVPLAEGSREQARLVALNPVSGLNCALLVERLAGLRNATQLQREPAAEPASPHPPFAGARFRDAEGRVWQEILLGALAREEQFLAIVG
jgi:twitching motility protein PilI